MNKENAQLKSQIYDLKAHIDELNQRLRISEQTKDDLSQKVEGSLADSEREHQTEIHQLQAQILSLQNQNKLESEKMKAKVQASENMSIKTQSENAVMRNQIGKILKLSENYFHIQFSDVKQLTDHLMHPAPEGAEAAKVAINESSEKDRAKIKHLKEVLEEERIRCKQLELEVIQLRQHLQTETAKNASQLNDAQDRERKLQNALNSMLNEHKIEIATLQNVLNRKKYHTMMTQTADYDFGCNELLNEANRETEAIKNQLIDAQNTINQQKSQLDALEGQTKDEETIREKLRHKVQKARAKNELMIKDMKEAQRRINVLVEKIEQSNDEKDELESQLVILKANAEEIQAQYDITSKELVSTKSTLQLLEKHMKSQIEEITRITNDRDHLLALVHTQNQVLQETEEVIEKIQDQLPSENQFAPKVQHNSSSSQSPSEWDFGTLSEELKSVLRGIAENDGFSLENRIAKIFKIVSLWFEKREEQYEDKIKELNEKIIKDTRTVSDFATSLLNAIDSDDSLNMDEITEAVSNLYKEKLSLQQKVNELEAIPVVCDQATFNEMTETIESLQEIAKALRNKCKQRKEELHECKEAFAAVKEKSDDEIATMREANEKSRTIIDSLQTQLDELHTQNQELLDELNDAKNAHLNEYNQAQSEIENVLMEQSAKYDALKAETDKLIRARDEKLQVYQNKVKEFDNSLKKWEEISRDSNDENRKLKSQINKITLEKDEQFSRMVRQKEKEARQIEDKYQTMIEKLKEKSNETEELVQAMTKDIEENEQKMKQMTQQMATLQFQLQNANLKAQSKIDSIERTKKLAIAQLKAQLMAVETNYSLKHDEQKHIWEAEKRSLFGYIAQQFGSFFDAKQQLNEESFKQVVLKIKNEMERHKKQEKTIRKLLKAKESQTTEDALADLVLYMHPQLQPKNTIF
ncbi:coiled-coil domain-containing protein [Tritrichomonas foetus]|uniref:Coiled-coil domain-containing protein n=1 Tax=Tritrichomonas foetus TaxID=1144522 RepID=A0A1J4JQT0_9EUKA|nr:coiled-coil domain-containing protein [Tritrichomonas foetus]OHS99604.1 coiled-coil domain-containing protein [Tritrichomonas foetus]|eukprot:OHS99604.1 coiled-coil domain-containing protein [Tritrichomonas foetus]